MAVKHDKKKDGLAPLSRLEGVIMGVLWDKGDSTAKEVRKMTQIMHIKTNNLILANQQLKNQYIRMESTQISLKFCSAAR